MTLGTRLKKSRKRAGLTQKQLSELSGVKQALISKIERGDQQSTTFIYDLSRALKLNPEWLINNERDFNKYLHFDDPISKEIIEKIKPFTERQKLLVLEYVKLIIKTINSN